MKYNKRDRTRRLFEIKRVAALFALVTPALSASAEDAAQVSMAPEVDGEHLAEVMVTARKREERVQDVPASIVAASGQTISDLNIVTVTELSTIAPGLTFVTDPGRFGSGPAIALRGVSTLTQSPAIQDSVGTVIDGIPISRAKAGAFPDLFDISHVEVLLGPQGTLFGKNATAGLINISTKDPTKTPEVQANVDYSTHEDVIVRASASGPLGSEAVLGRISLYSESRDGYIRNVYDGSKWDDDHQKGARAKLLYSPTPDDSIKLSGDFLEQSNDGGSETVRGFLPTTPAYIRTILTPIAGTDNDKIDANSVGEMVQRAAGGALQWDHSFNGYTLSGITGYRLWTQNSLSGTYGWATPLNGSATSGGGTYVTIDSHQYSGELRLASPTGGRVDYVGGLFVFDDEISSALFDPLPGLLAISNTGSLVGRQQRNWNNETRTLNYAAFGEANTHVTEQLTLTTGLRATHEKVDAEIFGLPTTPGLTRLVVPLGTTRDNKTAGNLSWRGGAQWRFDEDRMLYVSAATGWKGPGFNVVSSLPGNAQPVNPETSTSYEAGFKSQFLNRRLTANFDLFHAIYKNYQTQGFVVLPGTNVATVVIANAARLQTQGFEGELDARVTDSTQISMNATYIDAVFKDFPNAQCYTNEPVGPGECVGGMQNLSDKRLANTPKWAANFLAKQDFNLPLTSWKGFVMANYSWRSSIEWDMLGSPLAVEPAYGLLGASLGVQSSNEHFTVKLYGKNLTNQFHTEGIVVSQVLWQFLPVDYKRVLGVDVLVKF